MNFLRLMNVYVFLHLFQMKFFKVPRQYTLLGYKPHSTRLSVSGHIPRNVTRPLRTGAEVRIMLMRLLLLLLACCLVLFLF